MHKFSLLLLCYLLWHAAHSQSTSPFMGARVYAMGNSPVCITDEWSAFNNVAGLAEVKEIITSVSGLARSQLKSANSMAAVVTLPTSQGTIGLGVSKFGDNLYNESLVCLGFGRKIGITSIGVRINYNQFMTEGFGSKGLFGVSAGVITQLTSKFSIGALVLNINQPAISEYEGQRLAALFIAGVGYRASENLLIITEADKQIDKPLLIRCGFEYKVHQKFFIRTGISNNPGAGYGGVGFKGNKLSLDYAYRYDFNLGSSHQATLAFVLKKVKA